MPASIVIYIDADACPVKDETYRVAERYGLNVFVVANSFINTPRTPMSFERTSSDLGARSELGYAGQSTLSRSQARLFDSSAMAAPAGSTSSFAWLPKPPLRLLASSMQHLSPNLAAAGVRSASAPSWWA